MDQPSLTIRRMRSLLFAPANRPEVLAKLPRSGPDAVAIDLEDAVAAAGKAEARIHARALGPQLARAHPEIAVWVRVNATASSWFEADVAEALHPSLAGVIVPKVESAHQVSEIRSALVGGGVGELPIMAGIETALGVADARSILQADTVAAYFGAEDFTADMGGIRTESSREVLYARSQVALAARLAGVHVFDQVVADLRNEELFRSDAAEGRALGYHGKLCIHPAQVRWAHGAFTPSAEEVSRARALLAAYDEAAARGDAAIAFEGQMIDEPLAQRARALLAAAED